MSLVSLLNKILSYFTVGVTNLLFQYVQNFETELYEKAENQAQRLAYIEDIIIIAEARSYCFIVCHIGQCHTDTGQLFKRFG